MLLVTERTTTDGKCAKMYEYLGEEGKVVDVKINFGVIYCQAVRLPAM